MESKSKPDTFAIPNTAAGHDSWAMTFNKLLFSQASLTEPYFHPFPETYNIKLLCSDLALERSDFATIVDKRSQDVQHYFVPAATFVSLKDQSVLKRVKELLGLRVLLSMLTVDNNAILRWLKMPNPMLRNQTPVDCVKQGKTDEVADTLIYLLQGNQTA